MGKKKLNIRIPEYTLGEEIFNSVSYSGYNYNQDGTWSINVTCTFAESVGREGVNNEN